MFGSEIGCFHTLSHTDAPFLSRVEPLLGLGEKFLQEVESFQRYNTQLVWCHSCDSSPAHAQH